MQTIPNKHGLISIEQLKELIDYHNNSDKDSQIEKSSMKRLAIVEASWGNLSQAKDYNEGHIPGAIHVNTDLLETGYPEWKLKPLNSL